MNLNQVIFIGGGSRQAAAVQVRCVDIAQRLGCAFLRDVQQARQIPDRYRVFVCVKTALKPAELHELSQRGLVVWDVLDAFPPAKDVAVYLASTRLARELFANYGRLELIPHHHCNFEGVPSPSGLRRPVWIGSRHWLPHLRGLPYAVFFVEGKTRQEVAHAFRQSGIGLNFRGTQGLGKLARIRVGANAAARRKAVRVSFDFHLAINSGIKLINCIGFGLPSVSADEPSYHELGENCTIFSSQKNCAKWIRALQNDDDLYRDLRQKCLRRAARFHVDTIADKYRALFQSL